MKRGELPAPSCRPIWSMTAA